MASSQNGSCEHYQNSGTSPAFVFFKAERNGSSTQVHPQSAPNGLCYYPEASCGVESFHCCRPAPATLSMSDKAERLNMIFCVVVIVVAVYLPRLFRCLRKAEEEPTQEASSQETDEDEDEDEEEAEDEEAEKSCLYRMLRVLGWLAFMAIICAEAYALILTANTTQRHLSVPERNSMLAGEAFLVPLCEIFQFLEDVVAVKINAAMSAGDVHLVRPTLIMGVTGGMLCGTLAAATATLLCSWPAALQWLLAPYSIHDAYLECSLVPKGPDAAALARKYLLLQVWSWPAGFACRAIKGFLLGSGDILVGMVVLGLVNGLVTIGGIYIFFVRYPSLDTLGWISFASSFASFLILLCMFAARRDLRARYNLVLCKSGSQPDGRKTEFSVRALWKDASREGFLAMLLDVSAQMSVTLGIYTAGTRLGLGAMYQISSLQAAFPQFGLAWIWGITYILRLSGTQMVFRGDYEQFRGLFIFAVRYCTLLIVAVTFSVIPFKDALAFHQAEQACDYASDLACLPHYEHIFGGGGSKLGTLQETFMYFFVPVLFARCFFQVFKAGLYVCMDWSFMARVGIISFLCVFVPAILMAVFGLGTPSAIFVAMYLPWLAMAGTFMLRTRRNIKKMLAGLPGPWLKAPEDSESSTE